MPTLLLQISLKQWDKSQRSKSDALHRNAIATRHQIHAKPEFMLLDTPCLLDQFSMDFSQTQSQWLLGKQAGRTLKMGLQKDGSALLDRFLIHRDSNEKIQLSFYEDTQAPSLVGEINSDGIEAKYQWRYRTEVNNQIFWQYEEVTLNAALVENFAENFFLSKEPAQTFYKDLK